MAKTGKAGRPAGTSSFAATREQLKEARARITELEEALRSRDDQIAQLDDG